MSYKFFDFKCNRCNTVKEYFINDTDEPLCKSCASKDMTKLVSSPALLKTNFADKNSMRKT